MTGSFSDTFINLEDVSSVHGEEQSLLNINCENQTVLSQNSYVSIRGCILDGSFVERLKNSVTTQALAPSVSCDSLDKINLNFKNNKKLKSLSSSLSFSSNFSETSDPLSGSLLNSTSHNETKSYKNNLEENPFKKNVLKNLCAAVQFDSLFAESRNEAAIDQSACEAFLQRESLQICQLTLLNETSSYNAAEKVNNYGQITEEKEKLEKMEEESTNECPVENDIMAADVNCESSNVGGTHVTNSEDIIFSTDDGQLMTAKCADETPQNTSNIKQVETVENREVMKTDEHNRSEDISICDQFTAICNKEVCDILMMAGNENSDLKINDVSIETDHVFVRPSIPLKKGKSKTPSHLETTWPSKNQLTAGNNRTIKELSNNDFCDISEIPKDKSSVENGHVYHSTPVINSEHGTNTEKENAKTVTKTRKSSKLNRVSKSYMGTLVESISHSARKKRSTKEMSTSYSFGSKFNGVGSETNANCTVTESSNMSLCTPVEFNEKKKNSNSKSVYDSCKSRLIDEMIDKTLSQSSGKQTDLANDADSPVSRAVERQKRSKEASSPRDNPKLANSTVTSSGTKSKRHRLKCKETDRLPMDSGSNKADEGGVSINFRRLTRSVTRNNSIIQGPVLQETPKSRVGLSKNVLCADVSSSYSLRRRTNRTVRQKNNPLRTSNRHGASEASSLSDCTFFRNILHGVIRKQTTAYEETPKKSRKKRKNMGNVFPVKENKKGGRRKPEYFVDEDERFSMDGKPYEIPVLIKPAGWVSKKLYTFLVRKLDPVFNIEARLKSEEVVTVLCSVVSVVQSLPDSSQSSAYLLPLKRTLFQFNICKNVLDFNTFILLFTPFDFQVKVLPFAGMFGSSPGVASKRLDDPLFPEDEEE